LARVESWNVATRPTLEPEQASSTTGNGVAGAKSQPADGDIRRRRPYLLSRRPMRAFLRRLASITVLIVLDVSALVLGVYAALFAREVYRGDSSPLWGVLWRAEASWLPFLVVITVLVFWRAGLYARREIRGGAGHIVASLLLVTAVTFLFAIGTANDRFTTYGIFPTALVFTALLAVLFRGSYQACSAELMRLSGVRRRTLLVGEGESLGHLRESLGSVQNGISYEFVGALAPSPDEVDLPVLGDLGDLPAVLDSRPIDEVIVAEWDVGEQRLLELVEQAHRHGARVRIAPKTTALLVHRAEYVAGQGVPLFELRPATFTGVDWAAKRLFDVTVSVAVIVIGLPLWAIVAVGIKLGSRGPVFYRDRRIGLNEREFEMIKFRTMSADASERQAQLETENEADGPLFKMKHDPRVTRFGAVLRRLSLDEAPQVLNVLRGEMSLVGPRPLPLRDYVQLEPWHRKRYHVLPGITGLWQVSGRINLSFDDLVRLDFYYLDNWSIWLDISILAKTIPAVFARRGAY
jgi:exopolysaccharide biosynthesis polyprenyl glycosylphosphotransferase